MNETSARGAGQNARWQARSRAAVWHPCTQMKLHESVPLVPIARARGAWLYDFDGRRYLDAVGSADNPLQGLSMTGSLQPTLGTATSRT